MNDFLTVVVVLLGGVGTWLLLPHKLGRVKPPVAHGFGALATIVALLLLSGFYSSPGDFLRSSFFYGFATISVGGAIATITSRNPVHSALWFATVILSTSGLFLLAGAQFLAAGTIIVYAGAIIVTFLFVIMLAQSEGQAVYDRMSRAPGAASFSAFVLFWAVLYSAMTARTAEAPGANRADGDRLYSASKFISAIGPDGTAIPGSGRINAGTEAAAVMNRAISPWARLGNEKVVYLGTPPPHVAGLGATLFTDNLLAVELAGALLFVALIAAISIAAPKPPVRPSAMIVGPTESKAKVREPITV